MPSSKLNDLTLTLPSADRHYQFWWSPEGRMVWECDAPNSWSARSQFRRANPTYARFMGEVYFTVDGERPDAN
jgi:hypothetical protein